MRFRRGALGARLHHTNVCRSSISASEGIHYYAMQFIQGRGLDEVIAELRRLRQLQIRPHTAYFRNVALPGGLFGRGTPKRQIPG